MTTPEPDQTKPQPPRNDDITPGELRHWLEFACWTTLALAPFLYWINGPAVSQDQFVVRTGLVTIAAVGAAGFRFFAWRQKRSGSGSTG